MNSAFQRAINSNLCKENTVTMHQAMQCMIEIEMKFIFSDCVPSVLGHVADSCLLCNGLLCSIHKVYVVQLNPPIVPGEC